MKSMKQIGGMLAMAALAMGGTAQTAQVTESAGSSTVITTKATEEKKQVRQTRAVIPNPFGGLDFGYYDRGLSPKEFGMWLQSTGRQKWSKKH